MLHRIIYLSAATTVPGVPEIEAILDEARRWNASHGITGLLLYHDGNFFQVLEGPKEEVEAIFARIAIDARHGGVITLWSAATEARAFPDWQMGFARLDTLDPQQREGAFSIFALARDGSRPPADRITETLLRSFLRSFRDLPVA